MKSYILFATFAVVALLSCKKEKQQIAETLVFSTYAGMCGGNCFHVFKLDNTKLQEDEIPEHLTNYENYEFTATKTYNQAKYEAVKTLLNEIPAEFKGTTSIVYGCPDCHDQGGVFIQVITAGVTTYYNIDNANTIDQSIEVIEFKNKVRDAVELIMN